jgi:hypothetical protein
MRLLVLGMVLAGCSGASRRADRVSAVIDRGIDGFISAARAGDAAAIEKHFAAELVFGGMWFPDAECRRVFPAAGRVMPEARAQLARCIAMLKLAKGEREHFYPEIVVLTYEPGLEIEAQLGPRGSGDEIEIRWIGYVSRGDADDSLPTISPRALEQLHGGPLVVDDAARAKLDAELAAIKKLPGHDNVQTIHTWLKLCLDAEGNVATTGRATSSPATADAYAAAAQHWRFRPFVLEGTPEAVCSLVYLAHPKPNAGVTAKMPVVGVKLPDGYQSALMVDPAARRPIIGDRMVVPIDLDKVQLSRSNISRLMGTFLVCANETGQVDHVETIRTTGLPKYDQRILAKTRAWRYAPMRTADGTPAKACTMVTFIYTQR